MGEASMKKNITIGVLLVVIVCLIITIVKIENQRYAMVTGMCRDQNNTAMVDMKCLKQVETRTSWLWHLLYAFTD